METVSADLIRLKGSSCIITGNRDDAYRVVTGSVYVYIVPWKDQKAGRRSLLCEVQERELIPAFAYRDRDYEEWRFCLVAVEEATLTCMEGMCTAPLRKRFLDRAGVANPGGESYEDALVNRFRMNLVQEDGFLVRTGREREEVRRQTSQLIASFFSRNKQEEKKSEGMAVWQVTSELCRKMGISIADYERVTACCKAELSFVDIARVSHFPCREVVLEENWYRADAGALLVYFGKDREPAACIPRGQQGYQLYRSGRKKVKLTSELADQCEPRAWMIYRPLPQGAIRVKDFARYCIGGLSRADLVSVVLFTVIASLIGLLIPTLNQKLYDEFVPQGQLAMVYQIGYLIAAFMIGNAAFSVVKSLSSFRLTSRIESQVQNAVYYRVFELPERFFRRYESADLASRIMAVGGLAEEAAQLVFSLGISLIVSVIYLARMFSYSMVLSVTALLLLVIFSVVDYRISLKKLGYQKKLLELDGKTDSQMFQLIRGIEKIRIAGVEDRAILEYMKSFARQRRLATDLSRISIVSGTISSVFGGALTLTLYGLAYGAAGISMGEFVGFQSAFGTVSGTITGIGGALISYQLLKMSYERIRDMMETESEANEAKRLPEQLTGAVDLDHVVFSYEPYMPPVITDLSLHIRAGEYVGIVGASGCGKSTLLKLLLGFEKTDSGRIYYDNQDMDELDLQELRKRFGVVLQDGELISGSIFENITLTAGRAGQMEVMKVAEAVGLAEDIRAMPMGLQTVVSENCNTISGGQKQRILIARALINRPKIVFFDEATSALDNITQAQVCATLEQMDSTRVVIAHRLSTIKNCDRILVMDQGNIAEEGTYETLMEKRGLFYELASRQIL